MMAVLATTRAAMAAEGVPRGVGRGEAVFQSPRAAQRTASLTLSVASPTPSKPPRAETPPKAVLPASRSTSSRQEILEKLNTPRVGNTPRPENTPRTVGGGRLYESPRTQQPRSADSSFNMTVSPRPSTVGQFPVQPTSAMAILNASARKTVSHTLQEHAYASPRARQASPRVPPFAPHSPRRTSSALSSVASRPSAGHLEDMDNDLKRMLGTPVQAPAYEPLNIEGSTPKPEPEPEREPEPVLMLKREIVLEAEQRYAKERGRGSQAHLALLGLRSLDALGALDKTESTDAGQQSHQQTRRPLLQVREDPPMLRSQQEEPQLAQVQQQAETRTVQSLQQSYQQTWTPVLQRQEDAPMLQSRQQEEPQLAQVQQQAETRTVQSLQQSYQQTWTPVLQQDAVELVQQEKPPMVQSRRQDETRTVQWRLQEDPPMLQSRQKEETQTLQWRQEEPQGISRHEEQLEQKPSATRRLGLGQKLDSAAIVNKEWEQLKRETSKVPTIDDFRRERRAHDLDATATERTSKRTSLAATLAEESKRLEQRSSQAMLRLTPVGETVKLASYTRAKTPMERALEPSVLDDKLALSFLNSSSQRGN